MSIKREGNEGGCGEGEGILERLGEMCEWMMVCVCGGRGGGGWMRGVRKTDSGYYLVLHKVHKAIDIISPISCICSTVLSDGTSNIACNILCLYRSVRG